MVVDTGRSGLAASHQGRKYHFCCPVCRRTFLADPDKHLKPKKGLCRWLERVADSNEEVFGGRPRCH
jgi:YHS domain-containing protein